MNCGQGGPRGICRRFSNRHAKRIARLGVEAIIRVLVHVECVFRADGEIPPAICFLIFSCIVEGKGEIVEGKDEKSALFCEKPNRKRRRYPIL